MLDNEDDPFLIGQAADVKKYIKICLHGNGSLESEFDLGDSLEHIEEFTKRSIFSASSTRKTFFSPLPLERGTGVRLFGMSL